MKRRHEAAYHLVWMVWIYGWPKGRGPGAKIMDALRLLHPKAAKSVDDEMDNGCGDLGAVVKKHWPKRWESE